MKRLAAIALFAISSAFAQDDAGVARQRAAIASARAAAEAGYTTQEKACWQKFAVNDCLAEARAHRRQVLADLHRQEVGLNDAERKRKAAERQKSLEERDTAQRERDERDQAARDARRNDVPSAAQQGKAPSGASRAAPKGSDIAQRQLEKAQAQRRAASEAAARAADYDKRQKEAEERRRKLQERLANQRKPPAASLPVPP